MYIYFIILIVKLIAPAFHSLNPSRAGARRPRAGPGGHPPLLTRLLGHLATSGRRRSKARQKSFRKYFGHFLGQVKGKVTRGHRRSNFPYFSLFRYFFFI